MAGACRAKWTLREEKVEFNKCGVVQPLDLGFRKGLREGKRRCHQSRLDEVVLCSYLLGPGLIIGVIIGQVVCPGVHCMDYGGVCVACTD
jgi:hypothetical protein